MKYITTKGNDIFIFNEGIEHRAMANDLGLNVRGAGFVNLGTEKKCHGESVSLKISAHEDDTRTLEFHCR